MRAMLLLGLLLPLVPATSAAEDVCQSDVCVRDYAEAGCLGYGVYQGDRGATYGAGLCRFPFGSTSRDAMLCLGTNPCTTLP